MKITQKNLFTSASKTGVRTLQITRSLCAHTGMALTLAFGLTAGMAQAQVQAWTPSNLVSGVALWVDGSTATINAGTVTVTNAGSVGGTLSGPASLAAGGIGSLQAVQFNGTNQYVTGNYTNTGTTLTAFFVGKSLNSSQANYAGMMSVWTNGAANDFDNPGSAVLFNQNNNTANSIYTYRNGALSSTNGTLTTAFLADTVFNGSSDTLYLNGSPANSVNSSVSFNAGKVVLGCRWQTSSFNTWWNGNFGEAIICNASLSMLDRQKVEGYLAWKWGLQANLPATHPFKSGPPSANGGVLYYTDSNGLNPTNTPYANGYVVHTFYASDTFSNSTATSVEVLVVGGGGAGGGNMTPTGYSQGAGGGAGGLIYYGSSSPSLGASYPVAAGNIPVVVGAGGLKTSTGAGGPWTGGNGSNSSFGTLVALGGGGGGGGGVSNPGANGGSGGGGYEGAAGTALQPASGSGGLGNNGGANFSGGGGGAGAVGATPTGLGGIGLPYSIGGGSTYYAGGGSAAGAPGASLGGGGSPNVSGTSNTGGGGGGVWGAGSYPGSGGSGIVIVRYPYGPGVLSVSLTAPVNGRQFLPGASVTATAVVGNGTSPYSVNFYTNYNGGAYGLAGTVAASPYTVDLGTPANGTYEIYASVTDGVSSNATSSTNTFTVAPDTVAPTPNPMTFAVNPWSLDASTVVMTATTATDVFSPPVEYCFTNTVNGSSSGWLATTVWTNSGLTKGTTYGYQVMARDAVSNETAFSSVLNATPTEPTIFWDSNNTGAGRTDGGGTWINANQWWDGSANVTWNNSIPNNAIIGNGGGGGTITLGTVTAGSVVLTNFTGTYTLTAGSLTQSGGVTIAPTAANVTISTVIGGSGGLTKGGSGLLLLNNDGNSYSGPTVVTGGILQIGTAYNAGALSIPGGYTGNPSTGSNIELNGGMLAYWFIFNRTLGTGPGQIQITGGTSGFTERQSDRTDLTFNTASTQVKWGSAVFNPDVLVLNDAAASPANNVTFQNPLDLNGTNRTISTKSSTWGGVMPKTISNSSATPAGLTKSGIGTLTLTGANTFNGPVTISQGTLSVNGISNVANANPLGQSPAAAENLLLANGATLKYTGGATSCDRSFTINGTAAGDSASLDASGSGALNLTSTASPAYGTPNQSRKLILTGTSTAANTLAANIADNGSGQVSLTKTGTGTWVLTGNSTYSGNTVVTNGILRITNKNALSASTRLYLSTGGTIDLAFTGNQVIDELYINGVKQSLGSPVGANGVTITGTGALYSRAGTVIFFF